MLRGLRHHAPNPKELELKPFGSLLLLARPTSVLKCILVARAKKSGSCYWLTFLNKVNVSQRHNKKKIVKFFRMKFFLNTFLNIAQLFGFWPLLEREDGVCMSLSRTGSKMAKTVTKTIQNSTPFPCNTYKTATKTLQNTALFPPGSFLLVHHDRPRLMCYGRR